MTPGGGTDLAVVLVVDLARLQLTHEERETARGLVARHEVHGAQTLVVLLLGVGVLGDEQPHTAEVPLECGGQRPQFRRNTRAQLLRKSQWDFIAVSRTVRCFTNNPW